MKPLSSATGIAFFLLLAAPLFSQNSTLVIFSQNGEKFQLEVNGTLVNPAPQTRVEANRLVGPSIRVKVIPESPGQPALNKTFLNHPNARQYFFYKQDNRGRYILEKTTHDWGIEQSGRTERVSPSTPPGPRREAVHPSEMRSSGQETKPVPQESKPVPQESKPVPQESKPVPQGTKPVPQGTKPVPQENKPVQQDDKPVSVESTGTAGSSPLVGCQYPLNDAEFQFSVSTVSRHPTDGLRLTAAKNLSRTVCLTSSQVRDILFLFNSESARVEYSKFAYLYVYDRENYGVARDVLDPFSMEELDSYMRSVAKP